MNSIQLTGMVKEKNVSAKMLSVLLLLVVGTRGLCTPSNEMNQAHSLKVPVPTEKANRPVPPVKTLPHIAPSDLVIVYVPYSGDRYGGIGAVTMQDILHRFLIGGDSHSDRHFYEYYASVVQSEAEKEAFLELLDTQATEVKYPGDDSMILITEQRWNKLVIIDHFGVVAEFTEAHGVLIPGRRVYKLTPDVFQKIQNLVGKVFPQSPQSVLPATTDIKP